MGPGAVSLTLGTISSPQEKTTGGTIVVTAVQFAVSSGLGFSLDGFPECGRPALGAGRPGCQQLTQATPQVPSTDAADERFHGRHQIDRLKPGYSRAWHLNGYLRER